MNRLVRTIEADPDGAGPLTSPTTTYEYDEHGNQVAVIDPLGRVTRSLYDARNRLIATIRADGSIENTAYDLDNNPTGKKDANGNATTQVYDSRGRLIKETDASGKTVQYGYDAANQLVAITNEQGRLTRYTYDELGRRISETDNNGQTRYTEYDKVGNVTAEIDQLGHRTEYIYDHRDRQIRIIDAENTGLPAAQQAFTSMSHDVLGNLLSLTDPVGNTTSYQYDGLNRLVRETNELNKSRTYAYDALGNRISMTDRDGRTRRFEYDGLNRMTSENWLDGTGSTIRSVVSVYDAAGQLIRSYDPDSAYTYGYDLLGQLQMVDNAGTPNVPNVLLRYGYDDQGNLIAVTDAINGVVQATTSYLYDERNQLTRITQSGAGVQSKRVDMAYNNVGQFTQIRRYGSVDTSQPVVSSAYSYDSLNRLVNLTHSNVNNAVAFYDFGYDAASRITSITDIDGATDYSYNDRNELTAADHSNDLQNPDESYSYDDNGNRETSSRHGSGYVTGGNNQLDSDGVYDYFYDGEGNLIRQERIGSNEAREFGWDYRNRLVAVVDRVGGVETQRVEYAYDVLNRRIVKQVDMNPSDGANGVREHYIYDGDNALFDFIDADGDEVTALELSQRYLFGPQVDQVLAQEGFDSVVWHLTDHLGTVRDLVDEQGQRVNHFVYDSFGNTVAQTSNMETRYRYTGRELDQEVGLYYYRARYYNSEVGRFISQDPIGFEGNNRNLYGYAHNVPVSNTDPFGLFVPPPVPVLPPAPPVVPVPLPLPLPNTVPPIPAPYTLPAPPPQPNRNPLNPNEDCQKCPCEGWPQGGSYEQVRSGNRNRGAEVNHVPAWDSIKQSGIALGQLTQPMRFYYPNFPVLPFLNPKYLAAGYLISPAICMKQGAQKKLRSTGSSPDAQLWRRNQADLIADGRFRAAQNMDIVDIRENHGSIYDLGISQMLNYTARLRQGAATKYLFNLWTAIT